GSDGGLQTSGTQIQKRHTGVVIIPMYMTAIGILGAYGVMRSVETNSVTMSIFVIIKIQTFRAYIHSLKGKKRSMMGNYKLLWSIGLCGVEV
ncbi:hypothetical protein DRN45_04470, partial [Thermococci archaeon]